MHVHECLPSELDNENLKCFILGPLDQPGNSMFPMAIMFSQWYCCNTLVKVRTSMWLSQMVNYTSYVI